MPRATLCSDVSFGAGPAAMKPPQTPPRSVNSQEPCLRYRKKEISVITTPHQSTTYSSPAGSSIGRIIAAIRWPFTNKFAAPIWLALRLYIASIWFQMSVSKFQAGWLTSDPVGQLFKLIEKGTLPVPLPFYREVAGVLLNAGISPMISHSMPFL